MRKSITLKVFSFFATVLLSGCFNTLNQETVTSLSNGSTVSAQTLLPGEPKVSQATNITSSSATLSWLASIAKSVGEPGSYNIKYSTSANLLNPIERKSVSSPYTLMGLLPGTKYFYIVEAQNSAGVAASLVYDFTTTALPLNDTTPVPQLPGAPAVGSISSMQSSALVNWTAGTNAASHVIYYSTQSTLSTNIAGASMQNATSSPASISGLNPNTTYYYLVRATNATGSRDSLVGSSTTLPLAPPTPVPGTVNAQQTSATIPWTAGSGGGTTATYEIKYGTSPTLAGTVVNLTGLTSLSKSIPDSGGASLVPNTTYYYQITARNAGGFSTSTIRNFTTQAVPMGAPAALNASLITSISAKLNWSAPTSGSPIKYRVRYGTSSTFATSTTVDPAVTGMAISNLPSGTIIYFEVAAVYASSSVVSTSSFTTMVAAPGAPVLGTATPNQTSAIIPWSAGSGGPVVTYDLRWSAGSTLSSSPTVVLNVSPGHSLGGLTPNTTYAYKITANNASAVPADSIVKTFTTLVQAPNPPVVTVSAITLNSATVNWTPASTGGAPTSYLFKFGSTSDLSAVSAQSQTTATKSLTGLVDSTTYYVQVAATNGSGTSAYSSALPFTTLSAAPVVPIKLTVTGVTTGGATLGWWSGIGGAASLANFKTTLHPVMQNRCASCHSTNGSNGTSAHGSPVDSIALNAMYWKNTSGIQKVNFANPSASLLYTVAASGTHPCGTNCGASEILTAINSWKAGGGIAGSLPTQYRLKYNSGATLSTSPTVVGSVVSPRDISGLSSGMQYAYAIEAVGSGTLTSISTTGNFTTLTAPTPTPTPSTSVTPTSTPTSGPINYPVVLNLGDRRYVYSVLVDIFGVTDATTVTYLKTNVLKRSEFGGGCDRYALVVKAGNTSEFIDEDCSSGITETVLATTNASRFAYKSKVCNKLVNTTANLNSVFTKIFGSTTAGAVNAANLLKAYQLFNPEEGLSTSSQTQLSAVGNAGGAATDAARWKNIILALCLDPGWDKP